MGWRSLRVGLDRPALLRRQIRALLLAAAGRPLSVMFPMVATVAEFRAARGLLFTEAARVRPAPSELRIGTMLEIPALLWQLPTLLKDCHFLSIGSNDLMQFLFAADRGSPALAGRYDLLSPPVLDILEHVQRCAAGGGRDRLGLWRVCLPAARGAHLRRPGNNLAVDARVQPCSAPRRCCGRLTWVHSVPVLAGLRANATGEASLREPIAAWAREQGLEI